MSANELTSDAAGPARGLSATVALPFPGLERATSALRGQLRAARDEQALPAGPVHILEWDTLVIEGPMVAVDSDGRRWFTDTGQVPARAVRPVD